MRRLISIAAFALVLAVPLWAQRGGHGGGSHGGGFGGGHGGGHGGGFAGHAGGGGHFSGGMHSGAGVSRGFVHSSRPGFSRRPFLHDRFRNRFQTFGFRNNCFGWNCRRFVYPWWGTGYYDPWWYDSGSSYDQDYERDRAIANQMNWQSLEEQRMLHQEEADGDQDSYASRSAGPRPEPNHKRNSEENADPVLPPTVLVFRDQHRREIGNYAIVGQTLWNFSAGRTEKIALVDLDLAATEKANDDRGLTFRVPGTGEAQ
ncbi:MAG TPA: hypothetical protein VE377_27570 [Candidatus Dormibacteraeota bacterium]|nr:hypothetical protein [Candidatus Dormibacteraeota bacterium]